MSIIACSPLLGQRVEAIEVLVDSVVLGLHGAHQLEASHSRRSGLEVAPGRRHRISLLGAVQPGR